MKRFFKFIKTTIIGGVFFVVPVLLLFYIFAKTINVFRSVVTPLAELIPIDSIERITIARVIAAVFLVLLCFVAGVFAKTKLAQKIRSWIEEHVLSIIPGYSLLKSMGENMAGLNSTNSRQVVIVDLEEVWQIGFLMDEIDEELYSVFIPAAPNAMSGDVVFVKKERFRLLDVSDVEAMKISTHLGVDAKKHLKGSVKSTLFDKK